MIPSRCGFIDARDGYDPVLTLRTYNFNYYYKGDIAYMVSPGMLKSSSLTILVPKNNGLDVKSFICSHGELLRLKHALGYFDRNKKFIEATREDPLLGCAYKYRGLRVRRHHPWIATVIALMQQNTSFINAWRMLAKYIKNYSNIIKIFGDRIYVPFSPQQTLCLLTGYKGIYADTDKCIKRYERINTSPTIKRDTEKALLELRGKTGIGYRATTLLRLAYSFSTGQVSPDTPSHFASSLQDIKGFGQYSSRLSTLLAFGRYELPPLDQWTIRLAAEAYNTSPTHSKVEEEFLKRYGRNSGLAIYYLTILLDAERYQKASQRVRKKEICPKSKGITPLTLWQHNF